MSDGAAGSRARGAGRPAGCTGTIAGSALNPVTFPTDVVRVRLAPIRGDRSYALIALREAIPLTGLVLVLLDQRLPRPTLALAALALESLSPLVRPAARLPRTVVASLVAVFSALALVVGNGGAGSPLLLLWLALSVGSVLESPEDIVVAIASLAALAPIVDHHSPHAALVVAGAAAILVLCIAARRTSTRKLDALEEQIAIDTLTGVRNRLALDRRIDAFLAVEDPHGALVYIDIDGFQEINRTRGHAEADVVLKAIGAALTRVLPDAFIGRAGGDEFVLLLDRRRDPMAVAEHVLRVIAGAGPPGLRLTATAGVVYVPEDGTRPDEVRAAADQALRWGKAGSKGCALRYDLQRANSAPEVSEDDIRSLWLDDRISIHVQPIVDLRVGRIRGYEALARFSVEGDASPLRWFALADRLGLRPQLELACLKQALRLFELRPVGTYFSVNLSPDLLELSVVHAALDSLADLGGLVLELTEDATIDDYDRLAGLLARHVARGLRIAVDDFGTGQANFRHAWSILPRYLKLDRTLISSLDSDAARRALVGSIVAYAEDVGASLIAEGVETTAELEAVRHLGVPYAQGFRLGAPSEPWPVPDLDALLSTEYTVSASSRDPELIVVHETETAAALQQRFARNPRATAAVLHDDDRRVIGLLSRNRLLVALGVRLGFALHGERAALALADTDFAWAEPQTPRDSIVAQAMARDEGRRYDPVLLLDPGGRLVGKLTIQELLEPAIAADASGVPEHPFQTRGDRLVDDLQPTRRSPSAA